MLPAAQVPLALVEVRQRQPAVGPQRERDKGPAHPPGLVPGEVGLPRAVEVEVVDPAHHDVGSAGVGHHPEADADPDPFPPIERLAHVAGHL